MQTLRQPGKGREGEQPDQNLVRISQRSQMGPRLQTWGGEIAVSRFSFSFPFPRQRTTVGQYFDLLTRSAQQQQQKQKLSWKSLDFSYLLPFVQVCEMT